MMDGRSHVTPPAPGGPATTHSLDYAEPGVHVLDYLRIIYRRRWIAAGVFTTTLAAVGAYTFTAVPMYDAQAQILIDSDIPNVVNFQEVLDEGEARANYYQTQYELLRSRALALRTVN